MKILLDLIFSADEMHFERADYSNRRDDDEEGRVTLIHHKPWLLSTEKQEEGVSVDYALVPPPNMKRGFSYVHYIDLETKEQWYEEEEQPYTQEELAEIQDEKLDLIMMALLEQGGIL